MILNIWLITAVLTFANYVLETIQQIFVSFCDTVDLPGIAVVPTRHPTTQEDPMVP